MVFLATSGLVNRWAIAGMESCRLPPPHLAYAKGVDLIAPER